MYVVLVLVFYVVKSHHLLAWLHPRPRNVGDVAACLTPASHVISLRGTTSGARQWAGLTLYGGSGRSGQ